MLALIYVKFGVFGSVRRLPSGSQVFLIAPHVARDAWSRPQGDATQTGKTVGRHMPPNQIFHENTGSGKNLSDGDAIFGGGGSGGGGGQGQPHEGAFAALRRQYSAGLLGELFHQAGTQA